jgi:hypothetical protein
VSENLAYNDLTVSVRENPDTGFADIGPVVEGAFIPIGRVNLADFHDKIHEAAKAAADEAEQKSSRKSSSS